MPSNMKAALIYFYLACCKASNACDRELFVGHLLDAIFGWRRFKYRIGWLCASLRGVGEGEGMMRKNTKFNSLNVTYSDNSVFLHFAKNIMNRYVQVFL